jgi:hypothetical protein
MFYNVILNLSIIKKGLETENPQIKFHFEGFRVI